MTREDSHFSPGQPGRGGLVDPGKEEVTSELIRILLVEIVAIEMLPQRCKLRYNLLFWASDSVNF